MDVFVNFDFKENSWKDTSESFGEWRCERWDYEFTFVTLHPTHEVYDKYELVTVPYKLEHMQEVFFVWVLYSTGDSFGSGTGYLSDVGIYDTLEKAEKAKAQVLETGSNGFIDPEGMEVNTWPWTGYFERLQEVRVEKLCFIAN